MNFSTLSWLLLSLRSDLSEDIEYNMDLKKRLVICCIFVVNLTALSFSASDGKVTDLPHEEEPLQLSMDPTPSGKYKPDQTKWILLAILCTVIITFAFVIYCICSGRCEKCKSGNSEEQQRILSNEVSQAEFEQVKNERDFFEACSYREDVVLDPSTAHPRLEVSENGKCVRDTGKLLQVPKSEKRFDSHMFVLAREDFVEGKHYWEVEVGQKPSWDLGVASASVLKKGKIILAPCNGYWVIGHDDRNNYWARTDPWTRLEVSGKPTKIGMFLDISDKKLSLYDVNKKRKLYTFTNLHPGTFYPFFSMGSVKAKLDSSPLKI